MEAQRRAAMAAVRLTGHEEERYLRDPISLGTSESVYIVGEDFDSSSDGEKEFDVDELGEKKEFHTKTAEEINLMAEKARSSNMRIALILLSVLFAFSVGFNIYTG